MTITLRNRGLKDGRRSLYLDVYDNGRRRYEYLGLYLLPGGGKRIKEENRSTMALAEAVRAKMLVEAQNGRLGFEVDSEVLFFDYVERLAREKCLDNWDSVLMHLRRYERRDIKLADIDRRWVVGFKEYLSKCSSLRNDDKLSNTTRNLYFTKLKAVFNRAVKEGYLNRSPAMGVEPFKQKEKERVYLTLEEVRKMASTKCKDEVMKRAFLFSCLTGLRVSDVERLTWGDVSVMGGFTRITFQQKKTGGQEYLDISDEAVRYMGERGEPEELVFNGLIRGTYLSIKLRKWAKAAGVDKEITFHSARHTFAVMMLSLGVDIYTVQKLLGHKLITTTMVYAKVLDKNKQAAVELIPKIE